MLEAERHRVIVKLVQERSVVSITQLVEILGASEATIRRDMNVLAERCQLRRIHGGAESLAPRHQAHLVGTPFELSQAMATAQKQAIARAAAALVTDGDSIIIGGGTTTAALAEFLVDRQLDIFTNSLPVLTRLLAGSGNRLMLGGGTIFREQNIVLNPHPADGIDSFWGRKFFSSCYGLNRFGMMEADPLIVHAQTRLLQRAEDLVVMADSRKLRQRSSMVVAPLERIATLITDAGAKDEELQPFREAGITVIVANAEQRAFHSGAGRHAGPGRTPGSGVSH